MRDRISELAMQGIDPQRGRSMSWSAWRRHDILGRPEPRYSLQLEVGFNLYFLYYLAI